MGVPMPYEFRDEPRCPVCIRLGGASSWPLVAESPLSAAFVPSRQPTVGTTLVVPRRHLTAPGDLTGGEAEDLWQLLTDLVAATLAAWRPASYHVSVYVGAITGEPLEHLHWRLEPRYERPPAEWVDVAALPPTPPAERRRQADLLRAQLPTEVG
jgi:diadenosine tetraphosphate (Ap4A) HIT family hydrolase